MFGGKKGFIKCRRAKIIYFDAGVLEDIGVVVKVPGSRKSVSIYQQNDNRKKHKRGDILSLWIGLQFYGSQ